MPSTPSLIQTLRVDYPDITFSEAEYFSWSAPSKIVSYLASDPDLESLLLHEVSHALLDHHEYNRDIELVTMETAAWEQAKKIAAQYEVSIAEDTIEDNLDTYRDWLHSRSTCPACSATGYQSNATTYTCPACTQLWEVNEARDCALRRYAK